MALNPPLNATGEPLRVEGELFILQRKGMEFQVKVQGMGKMKGKGTVILTTTRIVLVNSKNLSKSEFKAFDIPLALTYQEKFNQPIFGANYLSGTCKPLFNQLPAEAEFKIWFMEGGCGKFLKCFRLALQKIRANANQGPPQALIQQVQSPAFQEQFAYFDPNDPSTIYISQPPVSSNSIPQQILPPPVHYQQPVPQYQPPPAYYQQPPSQYQQPPPQQYQYHSSHEEQKTSQQYYPNLQGTAGQGYSQPPTSIQTGSFQSQYQQEQPSPQVIPPSHSPDHQEPRSNPQDQNQPKPIYNYTYEE